MFCLLHLNLRRIHGLADETDNMGKIAEKTMTRSSLVTLAVIIGAFVLGFAYLTTNQPTEELRAQCAESFSRLDAESDDMQLDRQEFLAYREGVSEEDFTRADKDSDQSVTLQEFCAWTGASTERG